MNFPPVGTVDPPVEYTISEDRAAGNTAQAESDFTMLATRDGNLQQPVSPPLNCALQEYQMQLMLLKQLEKRRSMMARQNQVADPSQQATSSATPNLMETHTGSLSAEIVTPSNGSPTVNDASTGSAQTNAGKTLNTDERQNKSEESSNRHGALPEGEADCSVGPPSDEKVTAPASPPEGIAFLLRSTQLRHYVTLHRVTCSRMEQKCHYRVYEDEPCKVSIKGVPHIAGSKFIPNIEVYLATRGETAFIVYRDYHCDNGSRGPPNGFFLNHSGSKDVRESVSLVSEELRSIIRSISKFAPDKEAYGWRGGDSSPLLSTSPSEYSHYFLYHHREEIQNTMAETSSSAILALSAYLKTVPNPFYNKCDALFSKGQVSAETLPWLYQVNDILVAGEGSLNIAYVLRRPVNGSARLALDCWNWGYDGSSLCRRDKSLTVTGPAYETMSIRSLAVYPLRYAGEETKKELRETGEKFWQLRNRIHVSYEGSDYKGERVYPWDSRCMIDYQVYRKFHPHAEAFAFTNQPVATFDRWPEQIRGNTTLSPAESMLLPPGIHGFFLKEKKWVHLLVRSVKPVSWNKQAFDRLVLPGQMKNLVKALVMVRKTTVDGSPVQMGLKGKRDDIIRGKGSGLIMLLHGGPGTGKTLTAESVAELAEMPLYNVTCGDIGTNPEAVEKYLNSVLHLGKEWNCVLLLDEADVFLEERRLSDLERNSLVSVFLRTLEYYDGVLILTSNRVETFDEAFKSRIQVALHYPPLDLPSRRKIWQNFLDMLQEDNENADLSNIGEHMDELVKHEMNGRQIRNIITTARQLALFNKETLVWDHVEQSVLTAGDFDKHLKKPRKQSAEDWVTDFSTR